MLNKVVVDRALGEIPSADRLLLELLFREDRTSAQVGEELGLAPSSVRCRLRRIRVAHTTALQVSERAPPTTQVAVAQ